MSAKPSADEILQLRRKYKSALKAHRTDCDIIDQAPVEVKAPKRKRRKQEGPRSEAQKANDERLKERTARAREIRAANPELSWIEAVKQASAEAKKE